MRSRTTIRYWSSRPAWLRYVVAVLLVAAATAVRLAFTSILGTRVPYVVFYPALIVAALYGGLAAGLLATTLSSLAVSYFLLEPIWSFQIRDSGDVLGIGLFIAGGILMSFVCDAMRRAQAQAREAERRAEEMLQRLGADTTSVRQPGIISVFASVVVLTIVIGSLVWVLDSRINIANDEVVHIQGVIVALKGMISTLADVETGQRGFLLTGEDRYLQSYQTAVARTSQILVQLHQWAASGDITQREAADAGRLIREELDVLNRAIDLRREKGPEAALAIVRSDTGRRIMDDARLQISNLESRKELDLANAHASSDRTSAVRTVFGLIAAAVELAFLAWAYARIREGVIHSRQAGVEAERQRRLLFVTIENLAEGIVVSDIRGNILHWNRAGLAMRGFASLEQGRRNVSELVEIFELADMDGTVLPLEQWPLPRILRGEVLDNWEVRVRRLKEYSQRVFSYSGSLVYDPQGRPLLGVLRINDVTELKRAEAALKAAKVSAERAKAAAEQARTVAEQANHAKDEFLAVLSHELRTPLTPILAAVQLIQLKKRVGEELGGHLEIIRRNLELEARLIDDLLDLTRIVRGKVMLERKPLNICTVVQRVVDICMPDIKARKLHFRVDIKDPPHPVLGDASRLQQVLWNVLKNAVKFTPDGGRVGIHVYRENDQAIIEVMDSGIGIEPEALTRIFNAFEQENHFVTRQFGGLGLGLAISKRLVEMHAGTISARSTGKDRGATFRIALPLHYAEPVAAAVPAAPAAKSTTRRVLLVEDHGDTAFMMKMLLEESGYQVQTAGDVKQALDSTSSTEFDLLISDLGLPDGNGLDLIKELRRRGSSLRAIALSGYGREEDVQRSLEAGFDAHLTKPVNVSSLIEAVENVISSLRCG